MARILVVDDDPSIRQLIVMGLEPFGHKLSEAKDGVDAIEKVGYLAPELILLDVMMPRLDGWGVLRELRRRGLRGTTRVLLLTAKGGENDYVEGWNLGVDEYLTKPFDIERLADKIEETLDMTSAEIVARRKAELEKANLLARIDSAFGLGEV